MGYTLKINGVTADPTWESYEVISIPSMSPFCIGGCKKQLKNIEPDLYLVPGGYHVCSVCITGYCSREGIVIENVKHTLE